MNIFKGTEKLLKKGLGIFTGGDSRGVGSLQNTSEISALNKYLMDKGMGKGDTTAEVAGRQQSSKLMGDLSSAIRSSSGISGGVKQALINREGRKALGDVAMGTAAAASQERSNALLSALAGYQGAQSSALQREGLISQADQDDRNRRQKFVGALIKGTADFMKGKSGGGATT